MANEQLTSAAGQIYVDRRSSLAGENTEKLLFLAYNIRLFDFNYWFWLECTLSEKNIVKDIVYSQQVAVWPEKITAVY